nr:tetratricopeptide repeat protein [Geodermatophilaceae bacterium]
MTHPKSDSAPTDSSPVSETPPSAGNGELELPLTTADERPAEEVVPVPDPGIAIVAKAHEQVARGETSAALATLRALLSRDPSHIGARAALAGVLERRGDVEGALAELTRALEVSPDELPLLLGRASLH